MPDNLGFTLELCRKVKIIILNVLFSAGKLQEPEYHVKGEFWNEENEKIRNEIMSGWQRNISSFFYFPLFNSNRYYGK